MKPDLLSELEYLNRWWLGGKLKELVENEIARGTQSSIVSRRGAKDSQKRDALNKIRVCLDWFVWSVVVSQVY